MKRLSARTLLFIVVVSLFFVVPSSAVVNTELETDCGIATSSGITHDASGIPLGFYYFSTNYQGYSLNSVRPYLFTSSSSFTPTDMKAVFTTSPTPEYYERAPAGSFGGVDTGYNCDHLFRSGVYLYGSVTGVTVDLRAKGWKGWLFKLSYDPPDAYAAAGLFSLYDYYGKYDVLTGLMNDFSTTQLLSKMESYIGKDTYVHLKVEPTKRDEWASNSKSFSYRGTGVYYLAIAGGLDSLNSEKDDEYEMGVVVTGDYVASHELLSYNGVRSTVGTARLEDSRVLCSIVGEHILEEGFVGESGEIKCCGARSSDVGEINSKYVCARDGADKYQWVDMCGLPATPSAEYGFSSSDVTAINAAKAVPGVCCVESSDSGGYCSGTMKLRCDSDDTYYCPGLDATECADSRANCVYTAGGCYTTGSCPEPGFSQLSGSTPSRVLVPFEDEVSFLEPINGDDSCNCGGRSQSSCNSAFGCTWKSESCAASTSGNYPSCSSTWDIDFCRDIGCRVEDYNEVFRSTYSDECSRVYSKDDCIVTPDCYWKCKGELGDLCDQNKDCMSGLCRPDFYGDYRCQNAATADECLVGPYAGFWNNDIDSSMQINFGASNTRTVSENEYVCVDKVLRQCNVPIIPYDTTVCSSTVGFVCTGTPDAQVCSGSVYCSERSPSCDSAGCSMTTAFCSDAAICDAGAMVDGPAYTIPEGVLNVVGTSDEGFVTEASLEKIPGSDCGCANLGESSCKADPDCYWASSYCSGSPISCDKYYDGNVDACRTSPWCEVTPPTGFYSCTSGMADDDGDGTVEYNECDTGYGCERGCYEGSLDTIISPDEGRLACICAGDAWVNCYDDSDGDGFINDAIADDHRCIPSGQSNFAVDGMICNPSSTGAHVIDCSDYDPLVHPGAAEICDNKNNDCNYPNSPASSEYVNTPVDFGCDDDNDRYVEVGFTCTGSFRSEDNTLTTCTGHEGDCDDNDPSVYPGQTEFCNLLKDDDCDDTTPDDYCVTGVCNSEIGVCEPVIDYYRDADGDGYGNASVSVTTPTSGYVADKTDCDDSAPTCVPDSSGSWYSSCASMSPPGDAACFNALEHNCDITSIANCGVAGGPGEECMINNPGAIGSTINPGAPDLCNGDTMDDCRTATPDGEDDCLANQVCVSSGTWSNWVNRDSPGGTGDYELLANHYSEGNVPCDDAVAVECRTTGGLDYALTGEIVSCNPSGLVCVRANQPDGVCDYDYEVRFLCPDGGGGSCEYVVDCYPDVDGDGFGDASATPTQRITSCGGGETTDNTDCNDNDDMVYPGAPENCDGVINDCNDLGVLDGADQCSFATQYCDGASCRPTINCYTDGDGDGHGALTASVSRVNASSCPVGTVQDVHDDCDDANNQRFPGNPEVCDNIDNDCNNLIDDGGVGTCYADPLCSGTLDCRAEFFEDGLYYGACNTDMGCVEKPGRCSDTGIACDTDHQCAGVGVLCIGLDCTGFVSCQGLGAASCAANEPGDYDMTAGMGCSLPDCSSASIARDEIGTQPAYTCAETTSTCQWACTPPGPTYQEICSNRIDDDNADGDNNPLTGADCADTACNAGGSLSITDAELDRYNCLGTNQTGDKTGLSYYCGLAFDRRTSSYRDDVGLCCPVGQEPRFDTGFNVWQCEPTSPCYPEPAYQCGVTYSAANFNVWRQDVGCLDSSTPEACCLAVQFGEEDYYSNTGNVVIY